MDLVNLPVPTSSKDEKSTIVPSKRDIFLSTYRPNQLWSLPDSIIYYISKNPSTPKCYEKMIQSCKYFFIKYPLLVISRCIEYQKNGWNVLSNEKIIQFENITTKFWISDEIEIKNCVKTDINCLSSFIPKIYQSNIKKLVLHYLNISFKDLMFLAASKCEDIEFDKITVLEKDGTVVTIENLVEAFPFVKNFIYVFLSNISSKIFAFNSMKGLIKIPHFSNLDYFGLHFVVGSAFDIEIFYSYMKENKKTNFHFHFCGTSVEYKTRLQMIINEIITAEDYDYVPPYFEYPGIDHSDYRNMRRFLYY